MEGEAELSRKNWLEYAYLSAIRDRQVFQRDNGFIGRRDGSKKENGFSNPLNHGLESPCPFGELKVKR
jgi:hypothetical protein